jgi:hypothetical protein
MKHIHQSKVLKNVRFQLGQKLRAYLGWDKNYVLTMLYFLVRRDVYLSRARSVKLIPP